MKVDLLDMSMKQVIELYHEKNDGLLIYPNKNFSNGFFFYSNCFLNEERTKEYIFYVYVKKYKTKKTPKMIQIYDENGFYVGEIEYEKRFVVYKYYEKMKQELRLKKLKRLCC